MSGSGSSIRIQTKVRQGWAAPQDPTVKPTFYKITQGHSQMAGTDQEAGLHSRVSLVAAPPYGNTRALCFWNR